MSTTTNTLPEGWEIEREDRSVGIFGDLIWHDACPVEGEIVEAEVSEYVYGSKGKGANHVLFVKVFLDCPTCGASAMFTREDWDPTLPEDEPELPQDATGVDCAERYDGIDP